jgi:hypothetical protein
MRVLQGREATVGAAGSDRPYQVIRLEEQSRKHGLGLVRLVHGQSLTLARAPSRTGGR